MLRSFFILTLLGLTTFGWGQQRFSDISYDRIPYKKIRKYIEDQKLNSHAECIAQLEPTCVTENNSADFESYTKVYKVKAKPSDVWSVYLDASPTETWKTRKSDVGLVYDRKADQFFYSEDPCQGSAIGQVLYLNLKLAKGLFKLATSLEITNITSETNTIEISYLESGVNQGKQWISMSETEDGYTQIIHTSIIHSESKFRDRYLYPFFHNKLINAFHKKMRREVQHSLIAMN